MGPDKNQGSGTTALSATHDHGGADESLAKNRLGVAGIVFFVVAAAAPLVGMTGAVPVAIVLGNGAAIAPLYAWAMDDPRGDDTAASGYPSIWQPPAVRRVGPAS